MIQRAMILAAGTGSRLKPLTDDTPKALLPYQGKPMIEHVIGYLRDHGITNVVINLHHHADQLEQYIRNRQQDGTVFYISDERNELMDTGGGILKARDFLDEHGPFLVHNVDIKSNLRLSEFYQFHLETKALATLAVTSRETSRNFLVNNEGLLCGWRNNVSGEEIMVHEQPGLRPVAFSAIHILEPEIFDFLNDRLPFSITRAYLELVKNHRIMTYDHTGDEWTDMAHLSNFFTS